MNAATYLYEADAMVIQDFCVARRITKEKRTKRAILFRMRTSDKNLLKAHRPHCTPLLLNSVPLTNKRRRLVVNGAHWCKFNSLYLCRWTQKQIRSKWKCNREFRRYVCGGSYLMPVFVLLSFRCPIRRLMLEIIILCWELCEERAARPLGGGHMFVKL